jgi:2-iminobutanoate/2-iminopropanoate deaminase
MSKQSIGDGIRVDHLYFYTGYPYGVTGDWSVEKQIRAVLDRLKEDLQKAGSSLENVVKATVYLVNLDDRERYLNPLWEEYFDRTDVPVRCTIQAWLAPPAMVEIEFIAYVP